MISLRRMSLGSGYRYLMESVAVGDGAGNHRAGLSLYHAESGTPPGVFVVRGIAGLDGPLPGRSVVLALEQAVAVAEIATSGRVLDVLVGPAGPS